MANFLFNPGDDPTSHNFLHHSDNPSALIISEVFNGENYTSWSRSISMALSVKNKLAFIDGSLPAPNPPSGVIHNCWVRANDLVLSWLLNSINKEIRQSLLYISSAHEVWNELKAKYIRSDGPRVYHQEKSLNSISQGSQSLTAYYNSFKATWDEYISCRTLPKYNCGMLSSCMCDILHSISDTQQSDAVMKFLIGLNESYSALRSQLLLTSPLPPLARVYALLLQEENQRELHTDSFPESVINVSNSLATQLVGKDPEDYE
ncbi:uncharacterized protein LOC111409444 [Olea europaea var. sylvestris]|uniref:uncharacterized protein LOC111409444 n=1 Tax=Olea europaea var. sylvestris TaxID=158386 RepID=UPI000C1CD911|nr:uncharacterized protein LOC111409444 [Olea europaea var. sylvestris]